jgi:deoxyadenosine/deoxycytidine kinase
MVIWISGPTGAGKTSLARIFRRIGIAVIEERFPKTSSIAAESDLNEHCEDIQETIMRERYRKWKELSNAATVVFDRSIDEDAKIFCRMHHQLGLLDSKQNYRLQSLARSLQAAIPKPKLIVFMYPGSQVLARRVTELTHPRLIVENLSRQISLYHKWRRSRKESILRLDNSHCTPEALDKLVEVSRCAN